MPSPTGPSRPLFEPFSPSLPPALTARLGPAAPALHALGNPALLEQPLTALVCSRACPATLVLPAYDLAQALRDRGVAVVGGFRTPVERDCLDILLRGSGPIVVCWGRDLSSMRVPVAWRAALAQGRMLVVSPCRPGENRVTAETSRMCNGLVGALASQVVVVHASPGGATEGMCKAALARGTPLYALDHPSNTALLLMGARALVASAGFPEESRPFADDGGGRTAVTKGEP